MDARIPAIAPGTQPELAALEAKIVAKRGRITPLYQHLLNSPVMAEGWEEFLSAVRQRNSLPANLRELVILRVAVLNGAPYEFEAHVPHALDAGVTQAEIDAVRASEIGPGFADAARVALTLTDAMTRDIDVPDALFAQVQALFPQPQLLDLCITIGAYNMVSRVLVALHIGH